MEILWVNCRDVWWWRMVEEGDGVGVGMLLVGWMARHGNAYTERWVHDFQGSNFVSKTSEREVSHCSGGYAYVERDVSIYTLDLYPASRTPITLVYNHWN